jgi:hypothetical protein
MSLSIQFNNAHYDDDRQAVVIPAVDGNAKITCLVTSAALNDRASTSVDGEALLMVLWSLREEIAQLIEMMYRLGDFTAEGEIWLTSRELFR